MMLLGTDYSKEYFHWKMLLSLGRALVMDFITYITYDSVSKGSNMNF